MSDREHFENYREQTQVKHEILAAYLPAYFHILKKTNQNLLYIDGFAGAGTYMKASTGEIVDGSPLRALRLIAETPAFAERVSTIFIEAKRPRYVQLEQEVNAFYRNHPSIREPLCLLGTFAERVREVLQNVPGQLAPTFLFVDPCGVSGTDFVTIREVMVNDKCEAFIFFNIDGVRRVAGLRQLSSVLVDLMGSEHRAMTLYAELQETYDVATREQLILSHYLRAIHEDIGAPFTPAFRVESADKEKTSHYLIHASKDPLGFSIMKDVMWAHGHSESDQGALEFVQASRTNYYPLFDQSHDMKRSIIGALARGPVRVSVFYRDWVARPDNMLCRAAYRRALLELEADGNLQVLSKDRRRVVTRTDRPEPKGKPTLGEEYYVRLPSGPNKTY